MLHRGIGYRRGTPEGIEFAERFHNPFPSAAVSIEDLELGAERFESIREVEEATKNIFLRWIQVTNAENADYFFRNRMGALEQAKVVADVAQSILESGEICRLVGNIEQEMASYDMSFKKEKNRGGHEILSTRATLVIANEHLVPHWSKTVGLAIK